MQKFLENIKYSGKIFRIKKRHKKIENISSNYLISIGSRAPHRTGTGILNIENLRVVQSLDGHPCWENCIAYSPDGNFIATGGSEKTAIFWKLEGVGSDPIVLLMSYLDIPFTAAQRLVVD